MTNYERHCFVTEIENRENKPKTISDFYILLMDNFLENLNGHNDHENVSDLGLNLAVNF